MVGSVYIALSVRGFDRTFDIIEKMMKVVPALKLVLWGLFGLLSWIVIIFVFSIFCAIFGV